MLLLRCRNYRGHFISKDHQTLAPTTVLVYHISTTLRIQVTLITEKKRTLGATAITHIAPIASQDQISYLKAFQVLFAVQVLN